jgi:RNA polymerase sigma factor (TIGR02999 family)
VSEQPQADLTDLIRRAQDGDSRAFDDLFRATYDELRGLARQRLRRDQRGTLLDTTALVHESYLRFAAASRVRIEDRGHFMHFAARVMRSIVIDFIRERRAERRGGDAARISLTSGGADALVDPKTDGGESEILRVHEALDDLGKRDPKLVRLVEMRYFGGMTEAEVAKALEISERTVRRDWEKARLLLAEALAT